MVSTSRNNIEMIKSERFKKETKQKMLRIFFNMMSPRKGVVEGFPNTYFQQCF